RPAVRWSRLLPAPSERHNLLRRARFWCLRLLPLRLTLFLGRHAYSSCPYGFLQRVEFQLELLGNLGFAGAVREKPLNLLHHAFGQHRRTARHPRSIKTLRSLRPKKLYPSLHADRRDA